MEAIRIGDFKNYKLTENEVIERVLGGEKELYEILIRRNNQKLFRVIRSYINDNAEVEDIMQNTYLKSFEKLYQFKQESTFNTWLIRIGINEALARIREKGRVANLSTSLPENKSNAIFEIPGDDQMNPEKRIIIKEAKLLMERAVDSLKVEYRTVYMMREIEEMSMSDISECLDISIPNAKVRFHRAKQMLKEKLYSISTDSADLFGFGFEKCDGISDRVMNFLLGTR